MLKTFNPSHAYSSSGHLIQPVKTLTSEAKEIMKRVEMYENMEKEKMFM